MNLIDQLSQAWRDFTGTNDAERPEKEASTKQLRPRGDCQSIGELNNGNTLWECKSSYSGDSLPSLEEVADSIVNRIKGFFDSKRYTAGIRGGASGLVAPSSPAPLSGSVPPKAPSRIGK